MPPPDIPDKVKRLIAEHIPSVERLEILLLLADGRQHAWSVREIEDQIRSSVESVTKNLEALVAAHLAVYTAKSGPACRYHPASSQLDAVVTELALAYRTRRVTITELIYRNRAARNFSDAFRFGAP